MSLKKCFTRPTARLIFLDIFCDTAQRRFEVPEGKLWKLEIPVENALQDDWISFHDLENLTGKYTSMNAAVTPASLYTYHIFRKLPGTEGRGIVKISHNSL